MKVNPRLLHKCSSMLFYVGRLQLSLLKFICVACGGEGGSMNFKLIGYDPTLVSLLSSFLTNIYASSVGWVSQFLDTSWVSIFTK